MVRSKSVYYHNFLCLFLGNQCRYEAIGTLGDLYPSSLEIWAYFLFATKFANIECLENYKKKRRKMFVLDIPVVGGSGSLCAVQL